jgi:hypothetical protein
MLDRAAEERNAQPCAVPTPNSRAVAPRFSRASSQFYLSSRGTGDGLWKVQDGRRHQPTDAGAVD